MRADENFIPHRFIYDFATHLRHFDRYFQAIKLLNSLGKNEIWLDCACGSGYGTKLLSGFTAEVIGYDHDPEIIKYAISRYQSESCCFTHTLDALNPKSFQVIFSIETVEHMAREEAGGFLATLFKLLRPHGTLIISTPIPEKSNSKPANPFHLYEYDLPEFTDLLKNSHFHILEQILSPQQFTDGEIKNQGFFKCQKKLQ